MHSIQPKYTAHNLEAKQWQRISALSRRIWPQIVPEESRPCPGPPATWEESLDAVCDDLRRCFINGNEFAAYYANAFCHSLGKPSPDWAQEYFVNLGLDYMNSGDPRKLALSRRGPHGSKGLVKAMERDAHHDIAYSIADFKKYLGPQANNVAGQIWEDIINAPDVGGSEDATGKIVRTGGSPSNIGKAVKKIRKGGQRYRRILPRSMLSDIVTQCCASFIKLQDKSLLMPPTKK